MKPSKPMKFLFLALMAALCNFSAMSQNVNEMIDELKSEYAPDKRTAVWDVQAEEHYEAWLLKGEVDKPEYKQIILDRLDSEKLKYVDSIKVLGCGWGMVKLSVASLRAEGRHAAEMVSQAIMGMPVKLLEPAGEWYKVQTPDDYISFVPANSLALKSEKELAEWRKAKRMIVTVGNTVLLSQPGSGETVSDLVLGNILEYKGKKGNWLHVATPDGREGYVNSNQMEDFEKWSKQAFDADVIINTAKSMTGSGYLWGGTSTKLTDCSGLVKVSYFANAIILQRDASQQALTGLRINAAEWKESAKKGDLLFWGTKSGRVTHVGLYIGDGRYIHCSGQVKFNNLDSSAPDFLDTPFLSISRIDGCMGSFGIIPVRDHEWYFEKK